MSVRALLAQRFTRTGPIAVLLDWFTSTGHTLFNRAYRASGGTMIVRILDGTFVARIDATVNAADVQRTTTDLVLDTLGELHIEAFRVRTYSDTCSAVGIADTDAPHAFDALMRACADVPTYVGRVVGDRVVDLRPARSPRAWRHVKGATVIRIVQFVCDPTGQLVIGTNAACDVELWHATSGMLHAPRPNRVADEVPAAGAVVPMPADLFRRFPMPSLEPPSLSRPEFDGMLLDDVPFPIDVVYTWVDGFDPEWRERRDRALAEVGVELNDQAANESRFANRDELRYSLRSLHQYAPWVNHIWLVTDGQVPAWLDRHDPHITLVTHRELFGDRGTLPTFNSHAIESQLHRIDGLAEHFLYFNDDVMLGRPVTPHLFFQASGASKFFPSTAKIDAADPSILDVPVTAAGKNNRALIEAAFGLRVSFKMKHCPHSLRRSVLEEISRRFPEAVDATAHHQFRSVDDVSMPSSLYHYYAHATGVATPGALRYIYTDIADPDTPQRLRLALAKRDYDVLCLNDTDTDPDPVLHRMLSEFLDVYFPVPAPWETRPVRPSLPRPRTPQRLGVAA